MRTYPGMGKTLVKMAKQKILLKRKKPCTIHIHTCMETA